MKYRLKRSGQVMASNKSNQEEQDRAAFDELLFGPLSAMDEREEPGIPPVAFFQRLVADGYKEMKRRFWRDLLLFWIVGCMLVSGMVLLFVKDLRWFMAVQSAAFIGSLVFLARISNRRVKQRWMN